MGSDTISPVSNDIINYIVTYNFKKMAEKPASHQVAVRTPKRVHIFTGPLQQLNQFESSLELETVDEGGIFYAPLGNIFANVSHDVVTIVDSESLKKLHVLV